MCLCVVCIFFVLFSRSSFPGNLNGLKSWTWNVLWLCTFRMHQFYFVWGDTSKHSNGKAKKAKSENTTNNNDTNQKLNSFIRIVCCLATAQRTMHTISFSTNRQSYLFCAVICAWENKQAYAYTSTVFQHPPSIRFAGCGMLTCCTTLSTNSVDVPKFVKNPQIRANIPSRRTWSSSDEIANSEDRLK